MEVEHNVRHAAWTIDGEENKCQPKTYKLTVKKYGNAQHWKKLPQKTQDV
jgi:hypothetical protein